MDRPAILLMGPTAAGKTDVAMALAESLPVEIVSVDSAMVYRGMDIGTAKPDPQTLARVPHHLVDVADPAEGYSAGRFLQEAAAAMAGIRQRGRVPLLAGGTMLYFRALQSGLAVLPPADPGRQAPDRRTRGARRLAGAARRTVPPGSGRRIAHPATGPAEAATGPRDPGADR